VIHANMFACVNKLQADGTDPHDADWMKGELLERILRATVD